jgi:phosphatidylglycerol:prolipoprotein diacylglycerol transferase
MVAAGFSLATFLVYRRAPKFGINSERMIDYMILILASGVIGARILYVLVNFGYYRANPMEILNLSKGGLVWYGGLGAALLASAWFARIKKLDLLTVFDLMAPYVALGQAFGRIGCYLNGCCYGIAAPEHFLPGERHPTQLYSAALLFVIFAVLVKWQGRIRFKGEIALWYFILYSCKRFLIEFLRGDNDKIFLGLTMSQLISAVIFLAALVIFKIKADEWKRKAS